MMSVSTNALTLELRLAQIVYVEAPRPSPRSDLAPALESTLPDSRSPACLQLQNRAITGDCRIQTASS
jgi:hypothetical protein